MQAKASHIVCVSELKGGIKSMYENVCWNLAHASMWLMLITSAVSREEIPESTRRN